VSDARRFTETPYKPRANILAHFLENRSQPPIVSKVSVDLAVPRSVLTLANERGQLCQLARRERLNSFFDLSQTHARSMPKCRTIRPASIGGLASSKNPCKENVLMKFSNCCILTG